MSKLEIKTLKLSSIQADESQVRKTFNETSIKELAESIQSHGLIQPITVRPVENGYKIVAGERRFRACKSLGKKQLQCIVKDFDSDHKIREIQIIENLQREKVDAIEEAEAISYLLNNNSPTEIVGRIGRSYTYVRQRINLGGLIPYFKEAVQTGKLGIVKATLIGVYSAEEQLIMADSIGKLSDIKTIPDYQISTLLSERTYDLDKASFDTDDETLLPKAGACVTCPFNDANMGNLFKKGSPVCTKAHCFVTKKKKGLERIIEECKKENILLIPDVYSWGVEEKETQEIFKLFSKHNFKKYCSYQVDVLQNPGEKPSLEKVIERDFFNYNEEEDKEEAQEYLKATIESYEEELKEFEEAKSKGFSKAYLLNTKTYVIEEILVKIPTGKEEAKQTPVSQKKMDDCSPDEKITKIKARETRKKQIEGGKEFEEIVTAVSEGKYLDVKKPISEDEKIAFCITALQSNIGWYNREIFKNEKFFNLDCKAENYFQEFKKVFHEGIYHKILRYFIQTQVVLGEATPKTNNTDNAYYTAVKPYFEKEINKIEEAYKEREEAREAKMKARIAELEKELEN